MSEVHKLPPPSRDEQGGQGAEALIRTLRLGFNCLRIILLLLCLGYLLSGMLIATFGIEQNEAGFVFRFGRLASDKVMEKGIHWAWPKPIDKVEKLANKELLTISTGHQFWYFDDKSVLNDPKRSSGGNSIDPDRDGYLMTGDNNIIHTRWKLTYKIADPIDFYLNFRDVDNASKAILAALDNAVLKEVSSTTLDDAMLQGTTLLRDRVEARLRRNLQTMRVGIDVENLGYEKSYPKQTVAAFEKKTVARQIQETKTKEAETKAERIRTEAQGEYDQEIRRAEARRKLVVNSIRADTDQFKTLIDHIEKEGSSALLAYYARTLIEVLQGVDYVTSVPDGTQVRINLDHYLKK